MESTSQQEARQDLEQLWENFPSLGKFTEEKLTELFKQAQRARSRTTEDDHDRVRLQLAILYQVWLIDGRTGWMANTIIFSGDSTLTQKAKAFIIWFGLAPDGGFAH